MERNTNTLYILRFIAAVMVVWYHFGPYATFFTINGGEAVNFFFFISGFVMIIANAKYFTNADPYFSKKNFYVKRFARIYPLYLFALLALAFFHYFIKTIDTPTVKYRLPFEVLGVERWFYAGSFNSPGWTISCEFFFYLFFPVIVLYMRRYPAKFKIFAWSYFVLTYLITSTLHHLSQLKLSTITKLVVTGLYLNPVFLISIFILGMLCGKVFLDKKISFFKTPVYSVLTAVSCIVIVFCVKFYIPDYYMLSNGLLSPVYFLLVLSITSFSEKRTGFFNLKPVIFLGDISYSIYILQVPFLHYYSTYISVVKTWSALTLATLALIVFSGIMYYVIELPSKNYILMRFKKRKALKEADLAVL